MDADKRGSLTAEEIGILDHTLHRASNRLYCGDSDAMQRLVKLGLMQLSGTVAWCPDPYFVITNEGRRVLKDLRSSASIGG